MKNNSRTLLWAAVSILGLTSCSVQTTFVHPDLAATRARTSTTPGSSEPADSFPSFTPELIPQQTPPPASAPQVKTTKRTLCAAFVVPAMPERPRVDLSKLAQIPGNDHDAVKALLLDNIRDMNEHTKLVEKALKEAYEKHRRSCGLREVVVHEK